MSYNVIHTYHSVWIISYHSISCDHVLEKSYCIFCLFIMFVVFYGFNPYPHFLRKAQTFIGTYFSDIFPTPSRCSSPRFWMDLHRYGEDLIPLHFGACQDMDVAQACWQAKWRIGRQSISKALWAVYLGNRNWPIHIKAIFGRFHFLNHI